MQRHFVKKYIFTALFLVAMLAFAVINFRQELPLLKEKFAGFSFENYKTFPAEVESVINENVYEKYSWIELYGLTEKVIGTHVDNGFSYVTDKNGSVNNIGYEISPEKQIQNKERIRKIVELARENDVVPIIILAPEKYVEGTTEYRAGIPYDNKRVYLEEIEQYASELGVACINANDYTDMMMEKTGDDIFYSTDHHWKAKAAFYMLEPLLNEMQKDWDMPLNPDGKYTNIENYNVYTYEDCFLGSFGRELGPNYTGFDDIDVIYPKYETAFTRSYMSTVESQPITITGTFVNSVLDTYNISNDIKMYENDKYSVYLDGVNLLDNITNHTNTQGPRVFAIRDSFMSPLGAFLANACSEEDLVWNVKYNGNLTELIENGDYDYLIIEVGSSNLISDDLFNCVP